MSVRWVVVALGAGDAGWLRRLDAWAEASTLPIEVLACSSAGAVRARLDGTRPVSAALIDGASPSLDRDLLHRATPGCPIVVVDDRPGTRWSDLGAAAVLPRDFGAAALLDALGAVARPVAGAHEVPGDPASLDDAASLLGRLVAVCGSGGAGATTTAAALAQGIGHDAGGSALPAPVVLADLCRRGDLAMLHDARDILVGAQELIDAHRAGRPSPAHVRSHCLPVQARRFDLLLGVRQARAWTALRPRAIAAAIAGLRAAYATVVVDIEPELEGEADTGSADVEERHAMARSAALSADLVLAVGLPGLHGTHNLVRVCHDLVAAGVEPARILPVVNRAPRAAGPRAEITAAVAALCSTRAGRPGPPLFLPDAPIDACFRSGAPLPPAHCSRVVAAAAAAVSRLPLLALDAPEVAAPRRVVPGTLGFVDGAEAW